MIYQHKTVMDEKTWEFDLSTCKDIKNIKTVLAMLTCPQPLPAYKGTTCWPCSSSYKDNFMAMPIEIHVAGFVIRYRYQKNADGLWESEVEPINIPYIERAIEDYTRDTWGWRNIKHLWK